MNGITRLAAALLRRGMLGNVATELETVPTAANVGVFPVGGLILANDKLYRNVGTRAVPVFAAEPMIGVIKQTVAFDDFTDGGAAVGTLVLTDQIPDGAIFLASKVLVPAGFAGDTSAVLTIGDGSDADRYNTSTINVFATAASGVQAGIPSGNKYHTAAQSVTLTVTSGADFTSVNAGSLTVELFYLQTK